MLSRQAGQPGGVRFEFCPRTRLGLSTSPKPRPSVRGTPQVLRLTMGRGESFTLACLRGDSCISQAQASITEECGSSIARAGATWGMERQPSPHPHPCSPVGGTMVNFQGSAEVTREPLPDSPHHVCVLG